ncbi:MAG: cyclodeaminase/cyclohydrolase family protein, partial [Nocardioides sp.]|uniref:cyclodeaminase/cyclohydrolase family protein n=1 Tax=Nocardioides sp. TaxID=35761 RepID=UPI0039E61EE2
MTGLPLGDRRPEVESAGSTLGDWTAALAGHGPEPGGGAAAAVMAALGGSLVSMVAGYLPAGASAAERRLLRGTGDEGELLRRHALSA